MATIQNPIFNRAISEQVRPMAERARKGAAGRNRHQPGCEGHPARYHPAIAFAAFG